MGSVQVVRGPVRRYSPQTRLRSESRVSVLGLPPPPPLRGGCTQATLSFAIETKVFTLELQPIEINGCFRASTVCLAKTTATIHLLPT